MTKLFPSGWNATVLIGPKWPRTSPNSSMKICSQGSSAIRVETKMQIQCSLAWKKAASFPRPTLWKNRASKPPAFAAVVVTEAASCPPPSNTCDTNPFCQRIAVRREHIVSLQTTRGVSREHAMSRLNGACILQSGNAHFHTNQVPRS